MQSRPYKLVRLSISIELRCKKFDWNAAAPGIFWDFQFSKFSLGGLGILTAGCGAPQPRRSPEFLGCFCFLVAEWIHFTLLGIIFHYETESVYFWGAMNSATKVSSAFTHVAGY